MTQIQTLKKGDETIYPLTHMKGVVDDNGNTMDVLLAEAEKKALRKLFLAAGAEYNDTDQIIQKTAPWETEEKWRLEDDGTYTYWEEPATVEHLPKHYYLNGLGDITEEQMMEIYNATISLSTSYSWTSVLSVNTESDSSPRTNILSNIYYSGGCVKELDAAFYKSKIDIIKVGGFNNMNPIYPVMTPTKIDSAFYGCNARYILGGINILSVNNGSTGRMPNLIYIYVKNMKINFELFANAKNIEKRCVLFAIQYAAPTSEITITLHPDAYARIANQPDILEALEAQPLVTLVSA